MSGVLMRSAIMSSRQVEVVPAILRKTYEAIEQDWEAVRSSAQHIHVDVTDGIFAGDGTFRDLRRFKRLKESDKIELHMMVHTPANYLRDIIDLNPARCVWHLESFTGTADLSNMYQKLREQTQTELALALNPASPMDRLEEYLDLINYVQFMGYDPGWANQPLNPMIYVRIGQWRGKHLTVPVAADGHVNKETIGELVRAGATRLVANTAVFGAGHPAENLQQLQLLAEAGLAVK